MNELLLYHSIEEKERNNLSYDKFKESFGNFDFSFVSDEMSQIYFDWLTFRKQLKKPFKTQLSLEQNYKKLLKLADNSPVIARQIVDQSIERQWEGLFELKESKAKKDPMEIGIKLENNNPDKYKETW